LQRKLLKGLIKLDQEIDNVAEGKCMLKKHLSKFPVLIVLDDVDDEDHVDALLPVNDLHPESLILITARDRIVLARSGIQSICQLTGLEEHYSRELFCYYAFGQPHQPSEFESLVHQFLQACNGLPLCLKVFGKLVSRNDNKYYWEDELKRLKQTLHKGIPKSLQIGYDAKLKIGGGSGGTGSLGFLRPLSLDTGNTTGMHDQLTDLGRDLAKHPELPHLLWRGIEGIHDLKHKKMVLKWETRCEKCKKRALEIIASVEGVDSIAMDMKEKKITVMGEADPVSLKIQLRRIGFTQLISVGPGPGPGPKEKFLLL
jgi:hypothetical protein